MTIPSLRPGKALLHLRRKYGQGLRAAYYRDIIRPRILDTPPVKDTSDNTCEIHVLTSRNDWLNLLWTLKSFYLKSNRHYALCIHEDGSLDEEALSVLAKHFPGGRIIRRRDADARAEGALRGFPRCIHFRRTNLLAPKLFDFKISLEFERLAVFDSDLLFFEEPTAFLERVEDKYYLQNTFNRDNDTAYTVTPEVVLRLAQVELRPSVNSGFGLVQPESIRWDWIEEFLNLPGITSGHFWRIEQTLFALCSSRYGFEHLPEDYTVRLEAGLGNRPFRHYVGPIRHMMYSEGISKLKAENFLRSVL